MPTVSFVVTLSEKYNTVCATAVKLSTSLIIKLCIKITFILNRYNKQDTKHFLIQPQKLLLKM